MPTSVATPLSFKAPDKISEALAVFPFSVKRFKLGSIKTVTGMILEEQPDIAYVHINEFSVQTGKEFALP